MNGADSREAIKRYQTAIHQPADGIPHVRWEEPLEVLIRSRAQQQLQLLNLYNREINGRNDAATRNAIRRFEKSVGLPETGTLAPNVLMHLFSTQFLPQNAGIIVDPILKVTESSSNHSAPLAGNHNASIAPITQITQATQVTQAPAEQATLTVMPVVVQQTLTQLFRQQQALEAQANAEREAAEKEPRMPQKKQK